MAWSQLGDLEQVDTMQAQGVADYNLENILERYASQVWTGTGGGHMGNSNYNFNAQRAMDDTQSGFTGWVDRMTNATSNINEQFYNQIGGLNIDDDGYLEASGKAMEQMTLNLDEATKLLGQKIVQSGLSGICIRFIEKTSRRGNALLNRFKTLIYPEKKLRLVIEILLQEKHELII